MDLVYPRIERDVVTRTYGRFIISPLERGFGITIGNAIRRVLLSSLSGAAVSSGSSSAAPSRLDISNAALIIQCPPPLSP